jgi:nucleotide-binding universal stress UspA family protein
MRTVFETPMLATELSEFDEGAQRVALELARRLGRPLAVLLPLLSNAEFEVSAPDLSARIERQFHQKLEALNAAATAQSVKCECIVRRGADLAKEIVTAAIERETDLLVIRRRGTRSFLANLLVGEMVSAVLAHAPCPVLLVPRAARLWTHGILAAVDGSRMTERVATLAAAVAAADRLPLTLACVAVDTGPAACARAEQVLERARAAVGSEPAAAAVIVGEAHREIMGQALRVGADLIVIGRCGDSAPDRGVLGRTAKKVLGAAEGPVLVAGPSRDE